MNAHLAWSKLSSPLVQYLIGACLNLLYVAVLVSSDTSYKNLQLPVGVYADNLWKGSDVLTYVAPARNFVNNHVFGYGDVPDYHRTIGYPAFLSLLMLVFGSNWVIGAVFVQALIFATIYPALYGISRILFNAGPALAASSFLFFVISGTYITSVPVLMTDLFFTVVFTLGLWCGFEAIARKSWVYLLLQIVFMGYAGQVRPVLAIYPVINLVLLWFVARKNRIAIDASIARMIVVSSAALLMLGSLPSIRNYRNHGFFKSTDVLSDGMFNVLAYTVLRDNGKLAEYTSLRQRFEALEIGDAIQERQSAAVRVFLEYPLTTLMKMSRNAIGIMGRGHWTIAANFWGYNFKDLVDTDHMTAKRATPVVAVEVFFNFLYLALYVLLGAYLLRLLKTGNFAELLVLSLLLSYLLVPTFLISGAGSRYRLPAEGIIVLIAFVELELRLRSMKPYAVAFREESRP